MPKPTQQDTYDHIFGSSFDIYNWWGPVRPEWDQRKEAPHGWSVLVPYEDGDTGEWKKALITHSVILGAMRRLAKGDVKYASDSVARECRAFLKDPEDADFDANTADEVMQIATLGELVYC
ncbi:hypothetical protein ACFVYF_18900 [Streptomyces sp. NPDC058274]|uniref:hypothetical protein n=1 Tax=Streptomyces sp. NPDC058274 TaxID=3346416 RepID=UPI0036E6AFEF